MTLCIAVTCYHQGEPAIVLGSDWRSEAGSLAGGDVEDKLTWLLPPGKWPTLKAGDIAAANRLAAIFRTQFTANQNLLARDTFVSLMDMCITQYRFLLANDFLATTVGMDYASLLCGVKNQDATIFEFSPTFVEQELYKIEALPFPDAELIVGGFIEKGVPVMATINQQPPVGSNNRVRLETNFCAIGSGAPAALASLYRREHIGSQFQLMQSIYHAFEAKLVGEVSPGVGDATSITVAFANGDAWDLSSRGHKYMLDRFDYFGPMRIAKNKKRKELKTPWFPFEKECFAPYEAPWEKWGFAEPSLTGDESSPTVPPRKESPVETSPQRND